MSRVVLAGIAVAAIALSGCAQNRDVATNDEAAQNAAIETPAPAPVGQVPAPQQSPRPQPAMRQPQAARQATQQPMPAPITVANGTPIDLTLSDDLDSAVSQVGDTFSAQVESPVMVNGQEVIPAGSRVHGTVQEVVKAKRGAGKAKLVMAFDRLELPGGYSTPIAATLSEQSASKKKRNAAVIGGSAAGGALVGKLLGKNTKSAVVGSVVGGAIGTGVVMSKEGEQVTLPAGTPLAITLAEAVSIPAQRTR